MPPQLAPAPTGRTLWETLRDAARSGVDFSASEAGLRIHSAGGLGDDLAADLVHYREKIRALVEDGVVGETPPNVVSFAERRRARGSNATAGGGGSLA